MEQEIDVESPKKALTRLLEQMLNHLQKKDTHGFFTNPVNDQIAPGKKIQIPNTVRVRIDNNNVPTKK